MRFIHLSDLHLGKRVNEFSMLEDQRYILKQILEIIDDKQPDALLIAGDIYDRSVPSEEAVKLWDDFLTQLAAKKLQVFAISGNHDSAVRFSAHSTLVEQTGIHLAPVYDGQSVSYEFEDEYGIVHIYMLPFIKPAVVRAIFPEEEIEDYTDACRIAIKQMQVDTDERNIIVAHQFVVGASRCESEELSVGGMDEVSAEVFDGFDYAALGHLHGPQQISRETLRYCGTPLKYSFSEKNHKKSVTVVDMGAKGEMQIDTVPLKPLHDMRELRGTYEELTALKNYQGTAVDDYIHIVLTDEEDVYDAMARLRVIYPNLMKLSYDNKRTRADGQLEEIIDLEHRSPYELFGEFYETQNGSELSQEQGEFVKKLMTDIWEDL